MKLTIGLDLSTKCSGYSIFDENKNLIKYGQFKPKTTFTTLEKIHYIMWEFFNMFEKFTLEEEMDSIIIEDIFLNTFCKGKNQVLGFANLARLSGSIMTAIWIITGCEPHLITLRGANVARPMVGLKGNCQKAEVQTWVLQNFTDIETDEYEGLIEAIKIKKHLKEIDQKTYKKRMLEVSKIIQNDTDIGEDIADAILLGYGEAINDSKE